MFGGGFRSLCCVVILITTSVLHGLDVGVNLKLVGLLLAGLGGGFSGVLVVVLDSVVLVVVIVGLVIVAVVGIRVPIRLQTHPQPSHAQIVQV